VKLHLLENIHELQQSFRNNFEIISGKFSPEIKLFQTDVDKGWNNFVIILFHM